jgi:hypothetical protein
VNAVDIAMVLAHWGTGTVADTNGDGQINAQDIAGVLAHWGAPMP